jgi:hypothetical protein
MYHTLHFMRQGIHGFAQRTPRESRTHKPICKNSLTGTDARTRSPAKVDLRGVRCQPLRWIGQGVWDRDADAGGSGAARSEAQEADLDKEWKGSADEDARITKMKDGGHTWHTKRNTRWIWTRALSWP